MNLHSSCGMALLYLFYVTSRKKLPANQHALVLRQHKRSKVKYTSITVRTVTLRPGYENSRAIRDHTMLPAIRQS